MSLKLLSWLAISSALSATAAAEPPHRAPPDSKSLAIYLGDLNLGEPSGAREAVHRIRFAARDACGSNPSLQVLDYGAGFRTCVTQAFDDAVASLEDPLVSRLAAEEAAARGP